MNSIAFGNVGLRLAAVIMLVLPIGIWGAAYQQPSASDITSLPKGIQTHFLSTSRHPGFEIKKYLYLEKYGVHIMGTAGVSDWMMIKAFDLVEHVIGSMINSSDRSKFAGHQFFIIRDNDPDLRTVGAAAQKGQRNTGSAKYTVINEALVCREVELRSIDKGLFGKHRVR